jgi:hypothetical protein
MTKTPKPDAQQERDNQEAARILLRRHEEGKVVRLMDLQWAKMILGIPLTPLNNVGRIQKTA